MFDCWQSVTEHAISVKPHAARTEVQPANAPFRHGILNGVGTSKHADAAAHGAMHHNAFVLGVATQSHSVPATVTARGSLNLRPGFVPKLLLQISYLRTELPLGVH